MLFEKHEPGSKWHQSDVYIDRWLHNRQELLSQLYKLLQITPFEDEDLAFNSEDLSDFCSMLVDYVSCGHFEIFEKLAAADSKRDLTGYDSKIIQGILQTTLFAVEFNNRYTKDFDQDNLKPDLSLLGEELAKRMDLEDRLINAYMQATQTDQSPLSK